MGSGDLAQPMSAQAQPPRRPSGADKKQKPAKKPGGQGRSRNRFGSGDEGRFPVNSEQTAANQHCQTLWKPDPRPKPLTVYCHRSASEPLLDEKCLKPQRQKIVSETDLVGPDGPFPGAAERVPAARSARVVLRTFRPERGRAGMPDAQCTRRWGNGLSGGLPSKPR